MKKINFITSKIVLSLLIFSGIFYSCDEGGELDPGATQVVDMAGEWYVRVLIDGQEIVGYSQISTYNTAADDGNDIWVDDHNNIWAFKVKTPVNKDAKTFSGGNLESSVDHDDDADTPNYEITVNVSNGKVIKEGATTEAGNVTDSIYFEAEFSDDPNPGTIYQFAGYKRTGFLEDEH